MKLKLRVGDFRVRELLEEGTVGDRGAHRVYRVTKKKLTSPEAATVLAKEAGVEIGQVSMAGLKDRQGITIQHMSVFGGQEVLVDSEGLRIEAIGFRQEPLDSSVSLGNAFEITVRALNPGDLARLRANIPQVRAIGVPNYFDDQRFGNLRHGQGWIAMDLMRGETELALRTLLCHVSNSDPDHLARFKHRLLEGWGDFQKLAEDARRYGRHRSVFEHLVDHPGDFAGAFRFVASRERLIHLYAFQSHLWNRAVADLFREALPASELALLDCEEGRLICPAERLPEGISAEATLRLPGARLADVESPRELTLLADGLARHGLVPSQFEIHGVEGFQLKGEPRALMVIPRHLRVRPSEPDPEHPGFSQVKLRFELPRGAYATLMVKRLFARTESNRAVEAEAKAERRPQGRAGGGRASSSYEGPRYRPRSDRDPSASPGQGYGQRPTGAGGEHSHGQRSGSGPDRPRSGSNNYGSRGYSRDAERPYGRPTPWTDREGPDSGRGPRPQGPRGDFDARRGPPAGGGPGRYQGRPGGGQGGRSGDHRGGFDPRARGGESRSERGDAPRQRDGFQSQGPGRGFDSGSDRARGSGWGPVRGGGGGGGGGGGYERGARGDFGTRGPAGPPRQGGFDGPRRSGGFDSDGGGSRGGSGRTDSRGGPWQSGGRPSAGRSSGNSGGGYGGGHSKGQGRSGGGYGGRSSGGYGGRGGGGYGGRQGGKYGGGHGGGYGGGYGGGGAPDQGRPGSDRRGPPRDRGPRPDTRPDTRPDAGEGDGGS